MQPVEIKTSVQDLSEQTITRSTSLVTWKSCQEKMLNLMSLSVTQAIYQEYFKELGEFNLRRAPLARNGQAHHPFVLGADELIFNEIKKRTTQHDKLAVLELGCGRSFGFIDGPVLSEEDQAPSLSRALKSEFSHKIDITVSDKCTLKYYFYVDANGVLTNSVRQSGCPKKVNSSCQPYLSAEFEELYGLKTIVGTHANYESSSFCYDSHDFDVIYARNQYCDDPENYAEMLIKNALPKLRDDGIILFAFDTYELGSYNSRESNNTIVIRKNAAALDPNICIFDMNGQHIQTITPDTFAETKAMRPPPLHTL